MRRAPSESPCHRHRCTACCRGTQMSLTNADVARLGGAGHEGFHFQAEDGTLRLRNVGGHCVFLEEPTGDCRVYPIRPEGCELYPLVLDTERDRTVLDDFCPHRAEFAFSPEAHRRLRQSLEIEEREIGARRRRRVARSG